MNRPLLLRVLPVSLRIPVWSRLYRRNQPRWAPLYHQSRLAYAPHIKMELVPGCAISDCLAFTGVYEPALTRKVVQFAKSGGTLIDVGANLGYFALLWAAANPKNKCIAFEASPRILEILRRNIRQNGLESQVDVISSAAGKAQGKLQFDLGPSSQTGWGGFASDDTPNTTEVDVVRIDEVIKEDQPITLLKVDIEGADTWALMGCERLLKAKVVQRVWFEQNKPRMRSLGIPLDAAQNYLRSVGYVSHPQGDASGELVDWFAVPEHHPAAGS